MGSFYATLQSAANWMEQCGVEPTASATFVSQMHLNIAKKAAQLANAPVSSPSPTDKASDSVFGKLVGGLTQGGINVQVVDEMRKRGTYEQVGESLTSVLARIKAQRQEQHCTAGTASQAATQQQHKRGANGGATNEDGPSKKSKVEPTKCMRL